MTRKRKNQSKLKPYNRTRSSSQKEPIMTRILAWIRDPFRNKSGAPTRLALAAQAWGKSAPKVRRDASKLVRKGRTFLQRARSKQVHSKKRKA